MAVQHYQGNVLEEDHYYPFGLTISSTAAGTTAQPYKLTTKELEQSFDLNTYDFGARQYDMQIGRWTSIDPLAEKYLSMGGYNYCGDNPILYVDLDGMKFTEGAKEYVRSYQSDVDKRIEKNNNQIADFKSKIESGKISERRGNRNISRLTADNKEMTQIKMEISELEKSDQLYDIVEDRSVNGKGDMGKTQYNSLIQYRNGAVTAVLGVASTDMIAHEMLHMYQFEKGLLSFGAPIGEGKLSPNLFHDKSDEVAAYARGHLFGSEKYSIYNLPDHYKALPSGPKDFNSFPDLQNAEPHVLQHRANKYHQYFRVKGVTYSPQ